MAPPDDQHHPDELHQLAALLESFQGDGAQWRDHASCAGLDPDLFFTERGESTADPKAVCAACQVREDCLEFALAMGEKFGIWGGKSERERRAIRKARLIRSSGDRRDPAA